MTRINTDLPRRLARAALLGLALAAPVALTTSFMATTAVAQAGPDGEVDLDTFYRELSPHGEWFEHRRWGEVWRPNVSNDWRPYTRGHWAWTDEHGWYWVAEEEWGWAPFHYGRWVFDDEEEEWLWIPGYEWAPAWVQWRESEDAVGWAPLPPDAILNGGSLQFSATAYDSPRYSRYWVFAPPALMFLPGLYRHILPSSRHSTVWRSTRHVHFHHRYDRGRIYMPGIDHRRIERWTGRSVPAVTLRAVDNPRAYGWRNMQDRTVVPVYRPRVVPRTDVARPQRPTFGNPRGDRDRDGIPNWRDRRPNTPAPVVVRPGEGGPRGDRDRDGIPNWRDPRPNTPAPVVVRPGEGGPRGDRDRDGIPNWRDQRPNQPQQRPPGQERGPKPIQPLAAPAPTPSVGNAGNRGGFGGTPSQPPPKPTTAAPAQPIAPKPAAAPAPLPPKPPVTAAPTPATQPAGGGRGGSGGGGGGGGGGGKNKDKNKDKDQPGAPRNG